jgi:hypothetical protein
VPASAYPRGDMPARRLRRLASLLALLVVLTGVAAAGRHLAAGTGDRVPEQVEQGRDPVAEAAAVLRSGADRLRSPAASVGSPLAWLAVAALAAAALAVATVARDPVAVPSRSTAHVRRRGPPSPV